MNTIKHHISHFLLFALLLLTVASCSFPTYNRYNYSHRPRHGYYGYSRPILPPPARPGWYGRW